jgi:hypothetical protein
MVDIFVSLHGMCHNLQKADTPDYFTTVPSGLRVFTFAETNYCVYSNQASEKMMMHFLRSPHWVSSPECNPGGMFEHAQMYDAGSTIVNLMLDSDALPHFGVYELSTPPKRIPLVVDSTKKETTYDVERMLNTLKSKYPKTIRNVYFNICSPHTISPCCNSVLKWVGKTQPTRKATNKYDSFAITEKVMERAIKIQEKRIALDREGKARFLELSRRKGRMFLRSMGFPMKCRNGSLDHIPSQVGRGIGECADINELRGIYVAIDAQDKATNEQYEIYRQKYQIKLKELNAPKMDNT